MFKLESYLTPWLLGYLDKYVKLKPEDFQLSLWGGDATFNKLDLRLNVFENLTNIPIKFKSGLIHEMRIHIPWTRITSEPVVVTINTLEFVAELKEFDPSKSSQNTSNLSPNTSLPNSPSSSNLNQSAENQNQQQQQQVPAGYIQNIITKILFNIQLIVNNVIIKFVEDDIVLSFNMKSAELFSVNDQWEKSFVEVNSQNFHLRKIIQLNDVTICLDKLENKANNKINFYQDPLIYRFSIQSRLDFKYINNSSNASSFNQQLKLIKLNFYCRKFDVSITDQQLPMLIRLIELILAIVDGTLKLPESDKSDVEVSLNDNPINLGDVVFEQEALINQVKNMQVKNEPPKIIDDPNVMQQQQQQLNAIQDPQLADEQDEKGWLSWAWSYVPSVSTLITSDSTTDLTQLEPQNSVNKVELMIGCYFDEINVCFKVNINCILSLNI